MSVWLRFGKRYRSAIHLRMTARSLTVIAGGGLGRTAAAVQVPSLDAQPFRPGELPELLVLELSDEGAASAEEAAAKAGVPIELWVRVAVEVARHIRAIGESVAIAADLVAEALATAASDTSRDRVSAVDGRRQRAYAASLRGAGPRTPHRRRSRRLSLLVPDQTIAAWGMDAATAGVTLPTYVSSAVAASATLDVIALEAASAERAMTLGEWIYAAVLRELRRR
jgi:hypothetical protein